VSTWNEAAHLVTASPEKGFGLKASRANLPCTERWFLGIMRRPSPCFNRGCLSWSRVMPTEYDALYLRMLEALIRARNSTGLTRSQLAALIGMPVLVIADYESGAHRLDPAEFIAICRAIGVDPYALMQQAENADGGPMNGSQPEN
jgi:hypothetical protein